MIRFVFLLLISLLAFPLSAQNLIERDQYLFNLPPDSLFLHNIIKKDTISITYMSDQKDTARYRRIVTGIGSWTIQKTEMNDRMLKSIQLASGWEYRFDKPLKMLPPSFKIWENFSSESEFTAYHKGSRRGKGIFKIEIKVQNKDSARTPLRNFGDCIVLTNDASTTGSGFPKFSYTLKEWYARDTGLVKLAGSYTIGVNKTFKIASNLVRAQLQGEPLEGRN